MRVKGASNWPERVYDTLGMSFVVGKILHCWTSNGWTSHGLAGSDRVLMSNTAGNRKKFNDSSLTLILLWHTYTVGLVYKKQLYNEYSHFKNKLTNLWYHNSTEKVVINRGSHMWNNCPLVFKVLWIPNPLSLKPEKSKENGSKYSYFKSYMLC